LCTEVTGNQERKGAERGLEEKKKKKKKKKPKNASATWEQPPWGKRGTGGAPPRKLQGRVRKKKTVRKNRERES